MAQDAYLTDNPEALDISRQRKLADLLTGEMFNQPQGQMISGHYVAPSWTQQLAPLAKGIIGQSMNAKLDEKQLALAEALRGDIQTYSELLKTDPAKAIQFGLKSQNPTVKALVAEDLKTQKYGEGEIGQRRNISTGQMETVGQGGAKYHAPISVDTGNSTILLDPLTKQKIAEYPKAHQPVAGQVLETDNGPMLINTRTGQAQPIMANGQLLTGAGKPLTESQGNATAFGMRAKEANSLLTPLENKGITNTGLTRATISGAVGGTPFVGQHLENTANTLLNWTASPEQRQTKQARQNFVTAVLRKESGAAISPSEFRVEEEKYFPKINDDIETIKQKQKARELAIKALEVQAGPGKRQIEQMSAPKSTGQVKFLGFE